VDPVSSITLLGKIFMTMIVDEKIKLVDNWKLKEVMPKILMALHSFTKQYEHEPVFIDQLVSYFDWTLASILCQQQEPYVVILNS
jgi:hypothetical protein